MARPKKNKKINKRGRGRPKGSKNKSPQNTKTEKSQGRGRGRPKGSKNKKKVDFVKKLESEIIDTNNETNNKVKRTLASSFAIEQILFKLPYVEAPLVGTPQQVQKELDDLAIEMQKNPHKEEIFNRIHLYMHGYLINVVMKKFPFIRGLQTVDIYQETLIALRFKSIPNFQKDKGMSFLNFSKMCIRRHLITLLNTSKHRKKDQFMNQSISLDSSPVNNDTDNHSTYSNIISDPKSSADEIYEQEESIKATINHLMSILSDFEKMVLEEYLLGAPYKEIAQNLTVKSNEYYNAKSVDNALLRIRKKACQLLQNSRKDYLPIFMD
ncbi:MAG: hypothetical protein ACOCWG_02565 [bacterium]